MLSIGFSAHCTLYKTQLHMKYLPYLFKLVPSPVYSSTLLVPLRSSSCHWHRSYQRQLVMTLWPILTQLFHLTLSSCLCFWIPRCCLWHFATCNIPIPRQTSSFLNRSTDLTWRTIANQSWYPAHWQTCLKPGASPPFRYNAASVQKHLSFPTCHIFLLISHPSPISLIALSYKSALKASPNVEDNLTSLRHGMLKTAWKICSPNAWLPKTRRKLM